ncbi:MAG: GWxTD domain-containing protein [Acidobacteriota bacterium]
MCRCRRPVWPLALLLVALCLPAPVASSPLPGSAGIVQDVELEDWPRIDPDELSEEYRVWLEEEVRWIITDDERDVFLRLDTDEKRERFIEEFWRQRDPTPGTERNEYRELHYERFEYANDRFGRDTPQPGWRTDRGRIHILLGEPRSISRLPNTQLAYPVELWFYGADPRLGVPPFFYVMFFKDRGVGTYRLYSPVADGPSRLLNPAGESQARQGGGLGGGVGPGNLGGTGLSDQDRGAIEVLRTVDMELAQAAASLIPGEGGGLSLSPLRSEMLLSQIFDLPNRLMPSAAWSYRVLTGTAESEVRFETLPLDTEVVALLDPSGKPFLHWLARTPGERLNLHAYEDSYYVTFGLNTSVTDDELRSLVPPEDRQLEADLDEERARRVRGGDLAYMERVPLVPGRYRFGLMLENNVTREFARKDVEVDVPAANPERLGSSPALLVREAENLGEAYDPFAPHLPFQVGPWALIPAVDGPLPSGGTLSVYRQLYVPDSRSAPLLATYRLVGEDGEAVVETMRRIDVEDRNEHGVVDHLQEIDLTGVAPGEYRLVADVEEDDREPETLPVRLVDPEEAADERPYYHARTHPPASDPEVVLQRARQLRTVGRLEEAIAELGKTLERAPDLEGGLELQADMLMEAGRFQEVDELLSPRLVERPNDTDLLLQLAEVNARLGRHYDAIRYYERARLVGDVETPELLGDLASEYWAEGDADKARELLEQSLQLDPEQPQLRRLLERIRSEDARR